MTDIKKLREKVEKLPEGVYDGMGIWIDLRAYKEVLVEIVKIIEKMVSENE